MDQHTDMGIHKQPRLTRASASPRSNQITGEKAPTASKKRKAERKPQIQNVPKSPAPPH